MFGVVFDFPRAGLAIQLKGYCRYRHCKLLSARIHFQGLWSEMPVEDSEDALGVLGIFVWREEQSFLYDKVGVALANPGLDVHWSVRDLPLEVGVGDLSILPRVE